MLLNTPEERLFAYALGGGSVPKALLEQMPWESVFRFYPVEWLKAGDLPDHVRAHAAQRAMVNLQQNRRRLQLMSEMARFAEAEGIPLLFVKGAAEIATQPNAYLSARIMADIDVLCKPEHVARLHALMGAHGHVFYDYGVTPLFANAEARDAYLLKKMGQFVYNHGHASDKIEVHTALSGAKDIKNYPPQFLESLWEHARSVEVNGVMVRIPAPEHMMVQSLCHGASPKNVIFFPSFPPRERGQGLFAYIHFVLNREIIRHLCQLRLLLNANPELNRMQVLEMLRHVQNPLLKERMQRAAYVVDGAPWLEAPTLRALKRARWLLIAKQLGWQWLHHQFMVYARRVSGEKRLRMNYILLRICGRFVE